MVKSALVLLLALVVYWFILSGYFDHTVLYVCGAISIALVLGLMVRMKLLDDETVPYFHGKTIGYFFWLFKEIVKANMTVVKAVLSPEMEISPSVFKVDMKQSTDIGRTVFANSITLTPGTISVEMGEGEIMVHALLDEMTDLDGFAEMSERSGRSVNDPMLTIKKIPKAKKRAARKIPAKKASVKKVAAKKAVPKKTVTQKPSAKKTTTKKTATKKVAAKKNVTKKTTTKKTVAKKPARKKPAVKKSPTKPKVSK